VAKLREADEAVAQGHTSEDVAKKLGVSLAILQSWENRVRIV
jgi:transposase